MNLQSTYLGLDLSSPLVVAASPLSESIDNIKHMEDHGAGAVVLYSIFEEQIDHESHEIDHYLSMGTDSFAESLSYFPDLETYNTGPDSYLEHIRKAAETVDIPIIASLNGVDDGGWTAFARKIQDAGASALELNLYFLPTDPSQSATLVERQYLDTVSAVCSQLTIPVAVKLSPFLTAPAHFVQQMSDRGARGAVLFNRFYQPDFDLETLEVVPRLRLSTSTELRLPLRWIALLYGQVDLDLALTSGIHNAEDVLKALMAGARAAMLASELLARGIERLSEITGDLVQWMEENEYESVVQLQGSMSKMHIANPEAFARANYMKVLKSWRTDPTGTIL
jgi:dihydroorotate dehydrogenase (fumarate)